MQQIYNFSDYLTKYMHFKKITSNYTSFKRTFIQAEISIITRYILTSEFTFFSILVQCKVLTSLQEPCNFPFGLNI